MPFKLKLKKRSRQYNVTSKNLFVISVEHLLDSSSLVDCTLDSESTGKECLANVCQRLSINQPEFFGLRYIMKENTTESRWIDMERPLNRQLEKYAASQRLSLRVMYYVECGVSMIRDEVTRYYYFLQVKSDVVEGRILCDPQQAVILAIYARQAESDIHQKDKHTIDYLKTMLPFPKRLIEEGLSEKLTEEVLQQNSELNNLTQSGAEELYILTCQQLEGYGQERFPAKDDAGSEVFLVLSVWGITVCAANQTKVYRWRDITNVVNLKRNFNIECTVPENSVGFTMPDGEMGRYFWRLCVLQHLFYASNEKNMVSSGQSVPTASSVSLFQSSRAESVMDSRENLLIEQATNNWRASDQQLSGGSKWQSSDFVVNNVPLTTSQQTIDSSWATSTQMPSTQNSNWGLAPFAGSNASLSNRAHSSSCLDLTNNNTNGLSGAPPERQDDKLAAYRQLLPTYRQAPDYETAIQQKYRPSSSEVRLNSSVIQVPSGLLADGHVSGAGPLYSGSQPDVHRAALTADMIFGAQLQQHYPDVTQTTNPMYGGGAHMVDSSGVYGMDSMTQRFRMMKLNKPPPPYPANRLSSTSTPDLAVASHRALMGYRGAYVSGSSPDLVSSRTFLSNPYNQATYLKSNAAVINPGYYHMTGGGTVRLRHSQSYLPHGTYENLNYLEANGAAKPPPPPTIQSNNIFYCLQQHEMEQLLKQQNGTKQILHNPPTLAHQMNGGGSVEPIYENVPLPWHKEVTPQRERASSVTSGVKPVDNPPPIDAILNNVVESHKMLSKTTSNPISSASVYTSNPHQDHVQESNKRESVESSPKASLNRSHSTNLLDSSQSSNYTVATTDSGISAGSKEKRKKRWGILSRSKNSLDKQKSATLGREKSKSKNTLSKDEEDNIKHRWSTGLPRLQPLSANISKEKLCQILEDKLNDEELFIEFERIPKRKDNAKYDCALHDENKMKNLDPNFLPHDDNRVRLVPSMNNRMGYVNASHVTATVGSKQRFYIVAQSPFDNTTANIFWKCVWEADVYLLVQLSAEIQYVPSCSEKCLEYGQYQVWREFSQETDRCITSKLRIYHTQNKRYRSVWHIYYSDWNELNTPKSVGHFLDFLEELNSVRMASVNEIPPGHNTNPPVLIHCSEGGGRSGVTLAADLLLFTLDHNQDLDIPRVVGQMRHQRDNIVPSLTQYKFIYAVLIHYLKRTRLI
ncbi:tyrosine-protein phosphatase non-receptor type 14 [Phlebotomus argentipes]|uniref:tyrosine-protein phosphatase non-receptor type 14 n=1 Tax=Phlebotomus argentipes TaxID=94469 RepID=UPI002892BE23|nr:tyrosine-protein phosphatase non-receptor type 14 [Phlebotomus argentipes]